MNGDKDIKEKGIPMSSEDMFNSWTQMLNEGGTSNNEVSNISNNIIGSKVQDNPFAMINKDNGSSNDRNDNNQGVTFPKVNSHNSSAMSMDNDNTEQMASLQKGPNDEKSNSVFTNIFSENGANNQSENKINEASGVQNNSVTPNIPMDLAQDSDIDYKNEEKVIPRVGRNSMNSVMFKKPPKSLSSKDKGDDEEKNLKTSIVFLGIIFFGIGFFIYNTINNKNLEEDMNINNNSSVEKEQKKVEKVEEIPNEEEKSNVNSINTEATQELNTMCSLVDNNGNYQNNIANVTDLDHFVETAKYCQDNVCIYTKDKIVYSRNCQTGLENKMTLEEMKVSLKLAFACVEYNNHGEYVDNNSGITCKDGHCGATFNGRNFNQNCKKINK